MLVVGLTGSIGMGKSTAAARFKQQGVSVFDADAYVHELYAGAITADIEAAFPGTTADGTVDRAKLSAALLKDPLKIKILESMVHPKVRAAERLFLTNASRRGARIAVLDIPLLFEAGSAETVDVVIVVSAAKDVQRARVLARPGMSETKLASLLARQLDDEEKRRRADFVVDTSGSVEACNDQIDAILEQLKQRQGTAYYKYWL